MDHRRNRSTLALAVLSLLGEAERYGEGALHPYRMQQLIKERGKDEVVNVGQRASLYRTIERLEKAGLVHAARTAQDPGRPERTLYALTEQGRVVWREWMLDVLATPGRDFPEFPAAIAFIPLLTPQDVREQLDRRAAALRTKLSRMDEKSEEVAWLPMFPALESEYQRAALVFELDWVTAVLADLASGSLTWDEQWLRAQGEPRHRSARAARADHPAR
ncbi:PadR family transcriptional regulator [Kutzneria viridogrisea]|uniref:DNA-binding PadR family transcriptional regulator n=1 Tax=Kutzneria viridogrisea TaxID=47990 RepID=A0ABR6BHF0_9PSEU|nr:DNA-binding PadR family transcriptional regulator [Kutzneria viridogrisea]